jgi:hypothetical protein
MFGTYLEQNGSLKMKQAETTNATMKDIMEHEEQ